ncbi:MAG: methionine--tRNA ligase, partial [Patescibacteria group bacterium]
EASGKSPEELARENAAKFRALKQTLNLSWDDFIRTSDRNRHWPGATELWQRLASAGDIYKKSYRGLYCVGHEAFVTEKDLADGKCRDHQTRPEVVSEENWFFRLSRHADAILRRIDSDELRILPASRKNEILVFIRGGLADVSFSRPRKDLDWGIPVPGDETQTMYVWCDALANYITAIGFGRQDKEFLRWWPADLHVIGKDILRFHAVIWPGMLLSAGLPLPKEIFVHGHISVDGQKMSKTVGNVIDPVELVKRYGTDPVRYYLLREIPAHEDGDFSIAKFEERYNGDLANGLGNLVARVASLGEKVSPVAFNFPKDLLPNVRDAIHATFQNYEQAIVEIRLHAALAEVWRLIAFTDRYINAAAPWAVSDPDEFKRIITNAAYLVSTIANLIRPFLPETAEKIQELIRFEDSALHIRKGPNLFPRLG